MREVQEDTMTLTKITSATEVVVAEEASVEPMVLIPIDSTMTMSSKLSKNTNQELSPKESKKTPTKYLLNRQLITPLEGDSDKALPTLLLLKLLLPSLQSQSMLNMWRHQLYKPQKLRHQLR